MTDDGRMHCPSCGISRRVFVVFEHKGGEFAVCVVCVGGDLTKRTAPVTAGRSTS